MTSRSGRADEETMAKLNCIQKELRACRRRAWAGRVADLEEDLEQALTEDNKAEAQRLCRLLAGKCNGIRKRKTNTLRQYKPSRQELIETAEMPASSGGLSAVQVDWEKEKEEWITDPVDGSFQVLGYTRQETEAIESMARRDLKALGFGFRKCAKRKGCPPGLCLTK